MNWGAREPDPGSSTQARPHDHRVWSGGNSDSIVDIPNLHGLGNAPYGCRDARSFFNALLPTLRWSNCRSALMQSSHESDPLLGPAAKELVVNIAAVHYHDAALWQTQGARDFDFRHVAFGHVRVDW
jgi:hypothetical protein